MPFQYTCESCGNIFSRGQRPNARNPYRFCSRACQHEGTAEKRFWEKVDRRGPDECWSWLAHRSERGYGRVGMGGKVLQAHRVAFYLHYGRWPQHEAMHTCDNPPCCNPAHLVDGTHTDNMRDMFAKGRRRRPTGLPGERNSQAKLTNQAVGEIRERYQAGGVSLSQLGAEYGVCPQHVHRIVRGKRWVRGGGTVTVTLRGA